MRLETRDLDEKSIQFWKSVMKQVRWFVKYMLYKRFLIGRE